MLLKLVGVLAANHWQPILPFLPLPFHPHLNRIRRNNPRRQPGDQKIYESEAGDHLTVAIRRCIDVGTAGGQNAPEQPNLLAFTVGILFALQSLVIAYRCFGGHTGGGKKGEAGDEAQP